MSSSHVMNLFAPPPMREDLSYEGWKKEVDFWEFYAEKEVPKERQGAALLLSLKGTARKAASELEPNKIKCAEGVKNILEKLDALWAKDTVQAGFAAFDKLINFQRADNMSMRDYCVEFERLAARCAANGTALSSGIQACLLLKGSNISKDKKQLAKATVKDLKIDDMKKQLLKIYDEGVDGDATNQQDFDDTKIKVEPTLQACSNCQRHDDNTYVDEYEGTYHANSYQRSDQNRRGRGRGYPRGSYNQRPRYVRKPGELNPYGRGGKRTQCNKCCSIAHYELDCPLNKTDNDQGSSRL